MKKQYTQIQNFLQNYQKTQGCKGYVLGISGGKDSTITAKILVDAIGKENVLGVLMPNGNQKDIKDSLEVCELLDIDYVTINIEDSYESIIRQIEPWGGNQFPGDYYSCQTKKGLDFNISDKAKSNIAPRLRMTTLYAIAQTLGYRVAGTGNASERFVGWFTKWGDGACDINPIAHLTCTEVIALGDYLGLPEHLVHKTPADGITGKSDEENLGFTYTELDSYIKDRKDWLYDSCFVKNPTFEKMYAFSRHKFAPLIIED